MKIFIKRFKKAYNYLFKNKPLGYLHISGAILLQDKNSFVIDADGVYVELVSTTIMNNDFLSGKNLCCESCYTWFLEKFGTSLCVKFED